MSRKNLLTWPQLRELQDLGRNPDGYYGSCTNSTMGSLERRGLVRIEWSDVQGSVYRKEKWVITEEGRKFLSDRSAPK